MDMEVNGNIIEPGADLTNAYLWITDVTGETLTEDQLEAIAELLDFEVRRPH